MNLKEQLHTQALAAAKNFKTSEKALQEILREIYHHRVFYDLGYRSLMDYAISALGLTPDVAYNHCTVAKKSEDLPEVRKAISEGVVSVSVVRHMAPILTKENQREMIVLGSELSQSELRREVAKRNPELAEAPEKARYVREGRLALELRVSEELMKKLRRAQDLVSQSGRKLASLEETLDAMVHVFLEKRDPLKKAERVQQRSQGIEQLPLTDTESAPNGIRIIRKSPTHSVRISIPASIKHAVLLRSKGRCAHRSSDGIQCNQTRWLHFHHMKPLSEGGEHQTENLTVLCSGHHRMIHRELRVSGNS